MGKQSKRVKLSGVRQSKIYKSPLGSKGLMGTYKQPSPCVPHWYARCSFVFSYHSLLISNFIVIYRKTLTRAHLQGASFGLSEAFMFFANAAAFRYGGYLVEEGEMTMEEVFK